MTGLETTGRIVSRLVLPASPAAARAAEEAPAPGRRLPWRLLGGSALALAALSAALATGAVPRLRQGPAPDTAAASAAPDLPRVDVVPARRAAAASGRVLPGNARPLLEASLYPRATGYIRKRLADIGDRVEEGQLLAVIAAPDTDDQLAQAKANLAQARANLDRANADLDFARSENDRYRRLAAVRAASQEDYENKVSAHGVAKANVVAAAAAIQVNKAAVQRFTDLQAFEKVVAPFPGVITARHIDPGDLVTADSTNRELYHLMRTDVLRVFVNVPQVFATDVRVGQGAKVYRREDPQTQFTGKVTRTAGALDPSTRTLLTEVQVPNPTDALRPGMYLQVKFVFDRRVVPVLVPSAALATRAGGPRVAVLDGGQRVHYREVKLGRDFGAEVEVVAGLKPGEMVVVHPGDDLPDGKTVVPVAAK